MGNKIAGLRLVRINSDALVVAPKTTSLDEVRAFYERTEQIEAFLLEIVPFFDKTGKNKTETFADVVERADFDRSRLPAIL